MFQSLLNNFSLSDEEKSHLRIRFLQALNESTPSVSPYPSTF